MELCKLSSRALFTRAFEWWSRYMQPGRLKWLLWSISIGKICATSQQNIIVEIPGKVKYSSCSSGHTASSCISCFQVVVGVLKLLWQQDLICLLCLTISWDGGIFLCCGGSSCIYYRNNMTLKYQPVAIVLFWDCSTGVRKAGGFGLMETGYGFSVQVHCTIYLWFVTYALLCLHIYWQIFFFPF